MDSHFKCSGYLFKLLCPLAFVSTTIFFLLRIAHFCYHIFVVPFYSVLCCFFPINRHKYSLDSLFRILICFVLLVNLSDFCVTFYERMYNNREFWHRMALTLYSVNCDCRVNCTQNVYVNYMLEKVQVVLMTSEQIHWIDIIVECFSDELNALQSI